MRAAGVLFTLTFAAILLAGCSGGNVESFTTPIIPDKETSVGYETTQRILWGIWDISLDPEANSIIVTPSRGMDAHFNLTNFVTPPQCDDCLGITVEGFNPAGWVYDIKVSLRNPTHLTAYDIRGTLLIGAAGDNRKLVNADDYTELFDDSTPPDRNPFKVFAADQPGRAFMPDVTHEVLYQISIPPPPIFNVKYVIDGSWPNNQKDPYEIYDQEITGELYDDGSGTADIVVYVKDWQMNVEWVKLDITPLGAPDKLDLEHQVGIKWLGEITNEWLAPQGDYELWLDAKSQDNAQVLFDKINISIDSYQNTPPVWDDFTGITDVISGDEQVTVLYGTASDPDEPVTYNIYYSAAPITNYSTVGKIQHEPGSPSVVLPLPNNAPFWFGVRAEDGLGMEDDNTVQLSCTPYNKPPVWDDTVGITDAEPGDESVTVYFGTATDPSPPVTYNVYYSDTSPVNFDVADVISGNTESPVLIDGLTNGQEYYFAVRAQDNEDLEDDNTVEMQSTPDGFEGWGLTIGGQWMDRASGVITDDFGNIYVCGDFGGTVDFDPGPGVENRTSAGEHDAFICKLNQNGYLEWVRNWGGLKRTLGLELTLDASGNIYVLGDFYKTVDFDPGPGIVEHTSTGISWDTYMSKFDSTGDFQWVRVWGGKEDMSTTIFNGIVVNDAYSYIYVTGYFYDTVDFDPGPGTTQGTADGDYDIYLSKFTTDGDFLWVRTWGGIHDIMTLHDFAEAGSGVVLDDFGDVYVSGNFWISVDFDPGPGTDIHTTTGTTGGFVSKFTPSGVHQWTETWDGTGYALNYDNGYIYATGKGDSGTCLRKYDLTGAEQWAILWGPTITPDVKTDGLGNIYVPGNFGSTVDFDPGPELVEHTSNGYEDIYLSKFNSDGVFQWVSVWGGIDFEYSGNITVTEPGNILHVGVFSETVDFDPGPEMDEHTSNGSFDLFLTKLSAYGGW